MRSDFLEAAELAAIGFAALGEGVRISRHALFFAPERIRIGAQTRIDAFCVLSAGAGGITIGRNVHISAHATILGSGAVTIGDFCTVSVRCAIFASNDDYSGAAMTNPTLPARFRGAVDAPVTIGAHAILGAGSVVLPGVTIGESAAVGALSLVREDLPPFAIAAGAPARVVGRRRAEHRALAERYRSEAGRLMPPIPGPAAGLGPAESPASARAAVAASCVPGGRRGPASRAMAATGADPRDRRRARGASLRPLRRRAGAPADGGLPPISGAPPPPRPVPPARRCRPRRARGARSLR